MYDESIRGARTGGRAHRLTVQENRESWENKILWGVGITEEGLRIPILLVQEFRQYDLAGGGRSPAVEGARRLELWDGTAVRTEPPLGEPTAAVSVRGTSSSGREFELIVEKPTAARKVPG